MKRFFKALSLFVVSLLAVAAPTSVALGAFTQYGLPGIYNSSPFTLTNGQGSAISTDSQGRMLISPSSTLSSLSVTTLNATTINASTTNAGILTISSIASSPLIFTASSTVTAANYEIGRNSTGLYFNSPTGGDHTFSVNGVSVFNVSASTATITALPISQTYTIADGTTKGFNATYTTTGNSGTRTGVNFALTTGYTGTANVTAVIGDTPTAGVGNSWATGSGYSMRPAGGNIGVAGIARGTTTGLNIAGEFIASNGGLDIGIFAASTIAKASATKIGVVGLGFNDNATAPVQIGGYFGLYNSSAAPAWGVSAALIADNYTTASRVLDARVNNVSKFVIGPAGMANFSTSTVASAGDLTATSWYINVTGTTTINGLTTPSITSMSTEVILKFNGNLTVKHNTAASSGFSSMQLSGAADFSATDGDVLVLFWDGTYWREKSRTAI